MNPAGQSSISQLYHAATKQIGLEVCKGLQHRLQPSIEALCYQQRALATFLADKIFSSDCMALAATVPLPADILTHSLTVNSLEQIPPAVKPLALLLHLVIPNLSCGTQLCPAPSSSNKLSTLGLYSHSHQEQLVQQTAPASSPHDTASLLFCLQAAQQPSNRQGDTFLREQNAEQLLTLVHSALLVLKLATIPEHSQAAKGQSNCVTHMLWEISLQLVSSIQQHFKACLSMSELQQSTGDTSHEVFKPLAAVQHCAQLLLELLTKTAGQLVGQQKTLSADRAQASLQMMFMLLSEDESLFQGSATASKLISWGTALISMRHHFCNAADTFTLGSCKSFLLQMQLPVYAGDSVPQIFLSMLFYRLSAEYRRRIAPGQADVPGCF